MSLPSFFTHPHLALLLSEGPEDRVSVSTLRRLRQLLELVDRLDAGRPLGVRDIREHCDIKEPAARRYLKMLQDVRPLESYREGRHKVWRLRREPASGGAPLQRAAALRFATAALVELEGTPHHQSLIDLAQTARADLDDVGRSKLDRLVLGFRPLNTGRPLNPDRARWLVLLLGAIENRKACRMRYRRLGDGEERSYMVHPWGLVLHRGRLSLIAGKRSGGRPDERRRPERRTFSVDAILECQEEPGPRFVEPEPLDYESIYKDAYGIFTDLERPVEEIHLQVRGPWSRLFRQRAIHPSQHLVEADGGWWDLRLRLVCCQEFQAFVLSLLPNVRVLEPQSLREDTLRIVESWRLMARSGADP